MRFFILYAPKMLVLQDVEEILHIFQGDPARDIHGACSYRN